MIALEIADIKECMAHLLLRETFDNFEFISGSITTFCTFDIDGYLHKEFFDSDQDDASRHQDYAYWKDIRAYCFSLIKGKRTPLNFKFVFGLSHDRIEKLLTKSAPAFRSEQVQGLYLNFRYDGTTLQCVTGTSLHMFSLDKTLEHVWDETAVKLFRQYGITASAI